MKQVFIIVVIVAFIAFGTACSRKVANVADETNANTAVTESPFANITDPAAAVAEGDRLFDENQTEMAIEAYKQAVKLNPDLPDAHFKLGIAYALLEMQMLQNGDIVPGETNSNGKQDAVKKPRSEREFEKAIEAYKKWLAANPNDDAAVFNLARTYNKLNRDEDAEKEFTRATKLKPEDSEYQTELGAILIKLARYREAITPLKKAVDLDATNERAAGLLEDAEAGRQRLDYVAPKKDGNSNSNANANANSASNTSLTSNSNTNSARKPPPPANVNKPKKDEAVDKRPRMVGNRPN